MDNYLLEQQKQLKAHRSDLINMIIYALKAVLLNSVVASIVFISVWFDGSEYNAEKWITEVITFQGMEYSGNENYPRYYIIDQDNKQYRSYASDAKNEELMQQLIAGNNYTITYYFRNLDSENKIHMLRDDAHIYLNGNNRTNFDMLTDLRVMLYCCCVIVCSLGAVFIQQSSVIKKLLSKIQLYKKRICYFQQHNEPLPEKPSIDLTYEEIMRKAEESDSEYFNIQTAPVLLAHYVQNAWENYHGQVLYRRALIFGLVSSITLFVCLNVLLTANVQSEATWQTKEIAAAEIRADDYLFPGWKCYCLYDQEGNKYKLPSSVEYRYLTLKEQLVCGRAYEIIYGCNKYLFKNHNYLYGLSDNSAVYVSKAEATETLVNYNKYLKILLLIYPLAVIVLTVAVFRSRSVNNRLQTSRKVVIWFEVLQFFNKCTGLLLPEMYLLQKEKKINNVKIIREYEIIRQLQEGKPNRKNSSEKHNNVNETEALHKQFAARMYTLYIYCLTLFLLGGLCLAAGLQHKSNIAFINNITLCIMGVELLGLAVWVILLARPRMVEFYGQELVAYNSHYYLYIGWLAYISTMLLGSCCIYIGSIGNKDVWVLLIVLIPLYFYNIIAICVYRNHRIILSYEKIELVTFWGRHHYYQRSDIAIIALKPNNKVIISGTRSNKINVLDASGKKLFKIETNMINADKLYYALTGQQGEQK